MTKKFKTSVDGYKSKSQDRKRRGANGTSFLGETIGAGFKLIDALIPSSSSSKNSSKKQTNNSTDTLDSLIESASKINGFVQELKEKKTRNSEKDLSELGRLLSNIEIYQNAINNSNNIVAVKCALDEMLNSLDLIIDYKESTLISAGTNKASISEKKDFLTQNYDTILQQAEERSKIKE